MSGRHKRQRDRPEPAGRDEGLWVLSDLMPDGTYAVSVTFGPDQARVLDRPAAVRYCLAVLDAAQRADYDAAVLRQLTGKVGLDLNAAGQFVARELRPDRPPVDDAATAPVRFVPGVSQRTRAGFLTLMLDDEPVGQIDTAQAQEHALHVLNALAVADLDAQLHRTLVSALGLEDGSARAVVDDLQHWRDR